MTDLYQESLEESHLAIEYLYQKRSIPENISKSIQPGFLRTVKFYGKNIFDVLVFPILDSLGQVSVLECRSILSKQYFKIRNPKTRIPIFTSFNKQVVNKPIFLVEGVIEALSILAVDSSLNVASTLRASASKSQLHFLRYMFIDNLIILFNSDKSGINNALKIVSFYDVNYNLDVSTEELPEGYNDLNEALVDNPKLFHSYINNLKKDYIDENICY